MLALLPALPTARGEGVPAEDQALAAYVARPDPAFSWRIRKEGAFRKTRFTEILLTSQTWQNIAWKHQLYILEPSTMDPRSTHGLLLITGGRWRPEYEEPPSPREDLPRSAALFVRLAEALGSPMAVLRQVPFQPLFGGLTEDWIIALTFDRYLETGDPEWPLLLPMVKSAARAMDVVQAFARDRWGMNLASFTVTGASKRGWTTWLTGAVDARATAIAPMVIDVVNMAPQMEHAQEAWGAPSEQIRPYTERRLHERVTEPDGLRLLRIVDPYSYRDRLTQPKLIINGTNDEYWPVDALNLYWDDLAGANWALYVPNNGHGIRDYRRVLGSVIALHRHVALGEPFPEFRWSFHEADGRLDVVAHATPEPRHFRVWTATAPTRDLREARWRARPPRSVGGESTYRLRAARDAYRAVFVEAEFDTGRPAPLFLSTTVRVLEPSPPGAVGATDPPWRDRRPGPPAKR